MGKHLKKPVSLRLDEEEHKLLERLGKKHGGKSQAIVAGLRLLAGQNELTQSEVLDWIKANTK